MLLHKLRQSGRNMIDRPNKVKNNRDLNSFWSRQEQTVCGPYLLKVLIVIWTFL